MERSIIYMLLLLFTFWISFGILDVNKNQTLKQDSFETIRSSNQNALLDLQEKYNNYEELNTPAMVEEWLVNFVNNNNINWEDVEIEFIQIETDPPLYLIGIEGYQNSYAILGDKSYIKFYNGATIVSDDKEPNNIND